MEDIKLKAILRAYSKAPLYADFVRDIYSQEYVNAETPYIRIYTQIIDDNGHPSKKGEWVPLDQYFDISPVQGTYVQRTSYGGIKSAAPMEYDDVVNLQYLFSSRISEDKIDSLFTTSLNLNNGGDI